MKKKDNFGSLSLRKHTLKIAPQNLALLDHRIRKCSKHLIDGETSVDLLQETKEPKKGLCRKTKRMS